MGIENNPKTREEAEAAFLLIQETADRLPDDDLQRFWEVVHFHVAKAAGMVALETDPSQKSLRMTEPQAKAFGQTTMPWGKHKGNRVADVELDYLLWIAQRPDEFKEKLQRYLRSDRIQRGQ